MKVNFNSFDKQCLEIATVTRVFSSPLGLLHLNKQGNGEWHLIYGSGRQLKPYLKSLTRISIDDRKDDRCGIQFEGLPIYFDAKIHFMDVDYQALHIECRSATQLELYISNNLAYGGYFPTELVFNHG